MWKRGWDDECGGLRYYDDLKGLPIQEYWHDMKFWWPHCEAMIATALAWKLTGQERYAEWHEQVHDWSFEHFADPEFGEWFGYLRRDGSVSSRLKGSMFKGPFHLPRALWYCWKLLEADDRDTAPTP
ncbi:MAG: AGE family epimerase/isomerase [Armatimonadetes bacterium]|nr:AGE family epimerase/isomerase [Armatimonadota bacterium]